MQPRILAFLAFAMLILHAPGATAAPAPDALAQVQGDAATITWTSDPAIQPGDVLPLCTDATDVPNNHTLAGTITDDCFQPYTSAGPSIICGPIIINLFPVGVAPDEQCIESIGEWVLGTVLERLPIKVSIHLQQ